MTDSAGLEFMDSMNSTMSHSLGCPGGIATLPLWAPVLAVMDIVGYPVAAVLHGIDRAFQGIGHHASRHHACHRGGRYFETQPALNQDTASITKALLAGNKANTQVSSHVEVKENAELSFSKATNAPSFLHGEKLLNPKSTINVAAHEAPAPKMASLRK